MANVSLEKRKPESCNASSNTCEFNVSLTSSKPEIANESY